MTKGKKKLIKKLKPRYKNTLVVNLLAGPGAGKSTMAAALFAKLKWKGVECELAAEYAKDLVWEKRDKTFENQVYIFGKQHHRIFRLLGQVQVIITDSPLILTPIYDAEQRPDLKLLAISEFDKCYNLNVLVVRRKDYNPNGRRHTESTAAGVDKSVATFLKENFIPFECVDGNEGGAEYLMNLVLERIK